jgi:hypothetical protein
MQAVGLAACAVFTASCFGDGDFTLGKRLYEQGIGADGQPIAIIAQGDVAASGVQLNCAGCHRPSGFGSSEGGNYVPPITGPLLYQPRQLDRNRLFKELFQESQPPQFWAQVRRPRMRPAYTDKSLIRVIREGIDPSGRSLDALMPRYVLSDDDAAHLVAYLKGLSVRPDPGVDRQIIHLGTVVSDDVDPAAREAMLATMRAFFQWMNTDTAGDMRHPNFSPNYRSDFLSAYRTWKLHVWTLHGPPESWTAQLDAAYRAQPVFAVVSGLVRGPWTPVATFCNQRRLPCVFPNTELPDPHGEGGYSLYFSRGLELEAEALVAFLGKQNAPPGAVVQLAHCGPYGAAPAAALALELRRNSAESRLSTHRFADPSGLAALLDALAVTPPDVLVIWPGPLEDAAVQALNQSRPAVARIVLPSGALASAATGLDSTVAERTLLTYPYGLPSVIHPRAFRVRSWLGSRGLAISHPTLQFQTYYALTLLQYGLGHLLDDFFRDYLVEIIEHEAENALNPGVYPKLALGPAQRFASKGAFVVCLDPQAKGGIRAVSDWIVP